MKVGEVKYWVAQGQKVCEMLFWIELPTVLHSHLVPNGSLHCGLLEVLWKRGAPLSIQEDKAE